MIYFFHGYHNLLGAVYNVDFCSTRQIVSKYYCRVAKKITAQIPLPSKMGLIGRNNSILFDIIDKIKIVCMGKFKDEIASCQKKKG
jgi:hypothetical protein